AADPAAVVCGPAGLPAWTERADDIPVLACSLLPMGVRVAEPLPAGGHDVGIEVWGQPAAFTPYDPPDGSDVALVDGSVSQDELFSTARTAAGSPRTGSRTAAGSPRTATDGGRLLSAVNPASPPGITTLPRSLVTS